MKLAFDYTIFSLQSNGGISRYFINIIKELKNLGQEAQVFTKIHQNNYLNSLECKYKKNYFFLNLPNRGLNSINKINRILVQKNFTKWKPDILHETYFNNKTTFNHKCPIVITVHDMIHEIYKDKFNNNDTTISNKLKTIQRADRIICVSENTKNDLLNIYNINSNKISVIHHGVSFNLYNSSFVKKNYINKPYLLYVGSRGGYKNFQFFIKAIKYSKKLFYDFNIILFGGEKLSSEEKNLFILLGFTDNQILHLNGDDERLHQLYINASCFVYPSLYEGFGMPILEAMSSGCPVVASYISSIPEVGGNAIQYFEPQSIDSLISSIENVVYSKQRSNELVNLGYERIKSFSWINSAYNTLDVYKSLR